MKLTLIIILTTLISYGQTTKSKIDYKKIDSDSVDHVEIRQQLYDQTTIRLTDQQTKDFVDKWNNSKSVGPCKYMPKLWLTVTLTNGTTRTFRVNGDNIKEDNDWCYSIGDSEFFERLSTSNK